MSADSCRNGEDAVSKTLQIIDAAELDAVHVYMKDASFAAFLDQCLKQIATHIADLQSRNGSSERLSTMAHSMIGSAGIIGARKVEALARRLEVEAKAEAHAGPELDDLAEQLMAAWVEAAKELQRQRIV